MKIGILGGGQLGRMTAEQMLPLGFNFAFLDANPKAPCRVFKGFTVGNVQNAEEVVNFGKNFDIISYEWEHVSLEGLKKLENMGKKVYPSPDVLEIVQDKGLQKQFYAQNNINSSNFTLWDGKTDPEKYKITFPCVQKARKGGYDGKGVQVVDQKQDLWPIPSVLEEKIDIKKEIAVVVARSKHETKAFPVVEMLFDEKLNLVDEVQIPAEITEEIRTKSTQMAINLANKLDVIGVLAVEMFITKKNEVLINEVAPRPHNSGHIFTECGHTSQFQAWVLALLGLPFGNFSMKSHGIMVNMLGKSNGRAILQGTEEILKEKIVFLHHYDKPDCKTGRKMGHMVITGKNTEERKNILQKMNEKVGFFGEKEE